ncbi:Kinase suppressor of Ras 2 [Chelonia mydas]|uniref:Kinase suppressor of Ras 2 n=1 Tax=Chelonia mydas TaxID=8469 RepID=M7B826_CHEMY|nr:Kinase suppressor of Ras 2 [Chelonia mydas]
MDEENMTKSEEQQHLSLQKALQQCELVQNMIDISISNLEGLRTKCATSNDLTQKEIRTLERGGSCERGSGLDRLPFGMSGSCKYACRIIHSHNEHLEEVLSGEAKDLVGMEITYLGSPV